MGPGGLLAPLITSIRKSGNDGTRGPDLMMVMMMMMTMMMMCFFFLWARRLVL